MPKYEEWLTEEGLLRIKGWARDGLSEKQIAHNMNVSFNSLRAWKDKFPDIMGALKEGKDVADRVVENALYKSAIGYSIKIKKPVKVRVIDYDPKTGKKIRERDEWKAVEEEVHIPGNVTAQIFWLKNRKPAQWRDKTDVQQLPTNGVLESILAMEKGEKTS